jgi:hypothetical protein
MIPPFRYGHDTNMAVSQTETLDILSKADPRVRNIASEYLTV